MADAKPNPKHLALWAIAGASLASSTFLATFLPKQILESLTYRYEVLLTPFVLGLLVWFLAQRRLSRGYIEGLWSDPELSPVRAFLTNPLWPWTLAGVFLAALIALAFTKHSGALIYVTTLPMHALAVMRRLLVPTAEHSPSVLLDSSNFKPLHSDHWGEPAQRHEMPLPL